MSGLDAFVGERSVDTVAQMEQFGREIGAALHAGDLVVLTGPLGAGKTTLTRGIAQGLEVRGPIQSPTFVIARTHPSLIGGAPLVHIDAYRLGSPAELDDLGIDFDGSVAIVEWGRGMVDGLVDTWWEIEISRGWSGTGVDTACGTSGPAAREMEDLAPRSVIITRHG